MSYTNGHTSNNNLPKQTLDGDLSKQALDDVDGHPTPPALSGADLELQVYPLPHKTPPQDPQEPSEAEELTPYEKTRIKNKNKLDSVCVVGFCLGISTFMVFFHLPSLPRLPYPLSGNLQDIDPSLIVLDLWEDGVNLVPIVWGGKYLRKISMILVDFVCLLPHSRQARARVPRFRVRSGRPLPGPTTWPYYVLPAVCYHAIFGAWVGLATSYHLPYQTSDLEWVVVGLVVFLAGEITVVVKTGLGVWRKKSLPPGPPDPPVGALEVGEVLSCLGLAAFTLTFPACIMAAMRAVMAVPVFLGHLHGKVF